MQWRKRVTQWVRLIIARMEGLHWHFYLCNKSRIALELMLVLKYCTYHWFTSRRIKDTARVREQAISRLLWNLLLRPYSFNSLQWHQCVTHVVHLIIVHVVLWCWRVYPHDQSQFFVGVHTVSITDLSVNVTAQSYNPSYNWTNTCVQRTRTKQLCAPLTTTLGHPKSM